MFRTAWLAGAAATFALAVTVTADEFNTSGLGQNGWYSEDTRADGSGNLPANANLISDLLTADPEASASGTPGHDLDILNQIQFGVPPVAPPIGTHEAAVRLAIAPGPGGKSQISHRKDDATGFGNGALLADPGFLVEYSWMGDGAPNVTASFKIGIRTSEFGSTGVSSRTGENAWDKVLIYEPINNGRTADGAWHTETVTRSSGNWWFFDRTAGAGSNFAPFQTLAGMENNPTTYSGAKTLGDVYDLITDPNAVITSIQFGIGSGVNNASVYVNQLETSFYRPGDVTTFGNDGRLPVTTVNGDMIGRDGLPATGFISDTNGDVTVSLRARNRADTTTLSSGNIYYVNPGEHQSFEFQFTPSDDDLFSDGNYYLRLSVDLDPSSQIGGATCPGSLSPSGPLLLADNPIFDADGIAANSWDDIQVGDGRGDGLIKNGFDNSTDTELEPWTSAGPDYVYSQSWRASFPFINGDNIHLCPGDYTITWEVLEADPDLPTRTTLASVTAIMRVLDVPDTIPAYVNLTARDDCLNATDSQLIVDVDMQQASESVYGGMFFLEYDTTYLDFVSAEPGNAPFTLEVFENVDAINGTIDYAVGVPAGNIVGATGDATMARLTFDVGGALPDFCNLADLVRVRTNAPPTTLTDGEAAAIDTVTTDLGPVTRDSDPPVLTVPSDIVVNADAGFCSASVDPGIASVSDTCDPEPETTFVRSDGKPNLNDDFDAADSPITITWTATDDCGNTSMASQTVTVNAENTLGVTVGLAGVSAGPLTRCITFELFECGGGSTTVSADMTFSGGSASAVIDVPCGVYTCITARDELHTLRTTDDDDFGVSGTQYAADFTGADALTGGNINDDFYIDILDFGGYASRFGTNYGTADTLCGTPPLHADFSGNAAVGVEDFTFIQVNFLATSEPNCCGIGGATAPPVDRISVEELRLRGDDHLARGDVNHDGWLDQADLSAFILTGGAPCTADFNASGTVDVFDLLLYLDYWFAADPSAELAGNQNVDVFDLLAFLDAWFAGCP